jgi:predicted AAA+ superfamily ATPase
VGTTIVGVIERPLYAGLWDELAADRTMVFLAGPRQAGKTALARKIAEGYANRQYLNWDVVPDRARLLRDPYFFQTVDRRD